MKYPWSDESGFTLVDVLTGIQIFMLITLLGYAALQSFIRIYFRQLKQMNLWRQQAMEQVIDHSKQEQVGKPDFIQRNKIKR